MRLWTWITGLFTSDKPDAVYPIFDAETDPHIQWMKSQQRESQEAVQKRDWASISIQERLRGDPDPRERVR